MMQRSVKPRLNLLIAFCCCLTGVTGQVAPSPTNAKLEDKLWEAMGGRDNWLDARYFMFSCIGGPGSFAQGERKYLWDKQTGSCRFDGVTTDDEVITVLFNVENGAGTVFLNGARLDNPRTGGDIIAEIMEEFNRDAHLLFLPTIFEGGAVSYRVMGEKLIGTQRFTVVRIENKGTSFKTAVSGQLYIDSQTGRIRQWWPSDGAEGYVVGGYKSIGSGLLLPTRFTTSDTSTRIIYPIAAALVHIEGQKFSEP